MNELYRTAGEFTSYRPFFFRSLGFFFGVNGFGGVLNAFSIPRLKRSSAPGSSSTFIFGSLVMGRQLLLKKYPDAGFELGPGFLATRPEACVLIAQIIGLWSDVDFQSARLFAEFMGTETERSIGVFVSLRSARVQNQVLRTAAASALPSPKDIELFNAFMSAARTLESERNDLGHGLFGRTRESEKGVVWVSIDDRVKNAMAWKSASADKMPVAQAFKECIFIYELSDLERTKEQIEAFHTLLYIFVSYVARQSGSERDQLYEWLVDQPPIREELKALREKAKRCKS